MRAIISSLDYPRARAGSTRSIRGGRAKLNIALKEADETEYWLDLLHETQYLDDKQYTSLNDDCIEFVKMLTAAIKKLKE